MNTLTASHTVILATTQHAPAEMILDSGASISEVREQWKLSDISRISSMSIQDAFSDSMWPSIQDLLGREKLHAVLVPGMAYLSLTAPQVLKIK